ncbi:CFEM domain-containing protein [Ophiocordyceps sinensis CO18]|uniref:CFEM domain-containing protein n=1 Tax=Ophiocordyceps sinensis (strain Co18 / CGMCC 3.14243) TaxID=911162 RepID=T5AM29_OPHSC|nr:CFEM domain-containing protein [Ophiocordyceps sinensis CO18]
MVVTNAIALTSERQVGLWDAPLGSGTSLRLHAEAGMHSVRSAVLRDVRLTTQQLFWFAEIGYLPGLSLLKVSILLLYGRIFQTDKFLKMVRYGTLFFIAKTIAFIFPAAFQCMPPSAAWSHDPKAKCMNMMAAGYTWSVLGIVEDLVLIFLPIPTLWNLQMSRSKSLCVMGLLSIGSLTFVASVVRLKYIMQLGPTLDVTWDHVDIIQWTLIELLSAAVCSSILPCRHCPTRLLSHLRSCMSDRTPRNDTQILPDNGRPGGDPEMEAGRSPTLEPKATVSDTHS